MSETDRNDKSNDDRSDDMPADAAQVAATTSTVGPGDAAAATTSSAPGVADASPAAAPEATAATGGEGKKSAASIRGAAPPTGVETFALPDEDLSDEMRLRRVADGLLLLERLEIDDDRIDVLVQRIAARPSSSSLMAIETTFLAIDDAVPPAVFRERFKVEMLPADAMCSYATLLGRHAQSGPRFDRVELIATRLLTRQLPDGQLEVIPEDEALALIQRIAVAQRASDARREKAIAFFIHAAQTIETLASAHDLFKSGLYIDVQGYKRALREERLDPGIFYASLLLTVSMTNHVMRLTAGSRIERQVVLSRLASTDLKVDEIFREAAELDQGVHKVRAHRKRPRYEGENEYDRYVGKKPPRQGHHPAVVAGALLFIVVGGWAAFSPAEERNTLKRMPPDVVKSIAPQLLDAEMSSGRDAHTMMAHIDPAAWTLLSTEERNKVARKMLGGMKAESIVSAMVFNGDQLVVHIDDGRIVMVQ